MNPVELIGPSIAVIVGLLVLCWGIACRNGQFPRNPILGYRTVAAMRSTPAWNAAHRGYAPWIILSGLVLATAGGVALIGSLAGADGVLLPALVVGRTARGDGRGRRVRAPFPGRVSPREWETQRLVR